MSKSTIKKQIEEAAISFALQVVEAVKSATLEELIALQGGGSSPAVTGKRGRKPSKAATPKKVDGRKNRIVKNYPKCAYPKCQKNRFPRGKGFCGEHWRMWKEGKIKAASTYRKKTK